MGEKRGPRVVHLLLAAVAAIFVLGAVVGLVVGYNMGSAARSKDSPPSYVEQFAQAFCRLDEAGVAAHTATDQIRGDLLAYIQDLKYARWSCQEIWFIEKMPPDKNGSVFFMFGMKTSREGLWTERGDWMGFQFNTEGKLVDVDYNW